MSSPNPKISSDILSPYLPVLRRFARHLADTPEAADDLLQDTLANVWEKLANGTKPESLRAYLYATMRNLQRQGWRRARPTEELDETSASVPPDALRHLICDDLCAAVEALPPAQAELMHLLMQGETSPETLAQICGVPTGTVNSRLARARARLRAQLDLPDQGSAAELLEDEIA